MKRRYVLSKNINALFGFGDKKNKWVKSLAQKMGASDPKKCKIVEKDGFKFLNVDGDVFIVTENTDDIKTNQQTKIKKFVSNLLESIGAGFDQSAISTDIDAACTNLKTMIDNSTTEYRDVEVDSSGTKKTYYTTKVS